MFHPRLNAGEEGAAIPAEIFPVTELPEFTFVLHRSINIPGTWVTSELSSGMQFSEVSQYKKAQAFLISQRIERYGLQHIRKVIERNGGKPSFQKIPILFVS